MPLYEYECDACAHRFEVIQKLSDPPIEKCPVCGGGVHKLQSAPAFQFKGTGWYVTDYAKKDAGKAATSDGAAADGAGKESKDRESKDKDSKDKDSKEKTDKGASKSEKAEKSSKSDTSSSTNASAKDA